MYLGRIFNKSERQIQRYIANLVRCKYITINIDKNKRTINTVINKFLELRDKERFIENEIFQYDWLNEHEEDSE